jgi:type I restriction enzyme, S subunit
MAKRSERVPRSAAKTQVTNEAATETKQSGATLGFEAKLWLTADKLRNNMDAERDTGSDGAGPVPELVRGFRPVRAKLDGRKPHGLDKATAALFSPSFEESPLGPIPKGWIATTLGEACRAGGGDIQTGPFGTQLHSADYVPEGIPSIMPSDLRDNRIDPTSISRIREEDAERLRVYRVQTGDVVYSRRGDVERRSLIRQAEGSWLCGTGCLRVRFGARGLNPHFGASYLGTLESRAWVVRHAVGATMPNLNTSILGALPMVVPPPELQSLFGGIVGPWDDRGTVALEESRSLADLRDTLLPKLLSGELSA